MDRGFAIHGKIARMIGRSTWSTGQEADRAFGQIKLVAGARCGFHLPITALAIPHVAVRPLSFLILGPQVRVLSGAP